MPLPASTQDSLQPQLSRDWPRGRFIWITADQQCRIFVNYFDHLKLNVTQQEGNILKAFRRYTELLPGERAWKKVWNRQDKGLRGLQCKIRTFVVSPENIGTGLEVQVKVRLPKLIKVQNAGWWYKCDFPLLKTTLIFVNFPSGSLRS